MVPVKQVSAEATAALGWGAEYWDQNPEHYEGCTELRSRNPAMSDSKLANELSGDLLDGVLVAARC